MDKNNIKNLNFFKNLDEDQIDRLIQISSIQSYNENNILYYEKTQSSYLYFLIEGLVKSYKIDKHSNEIFLYYIQEGNIISEISTIYDNILYSYSNILFSEPSVILKIDYKLFKHKFLDTNILNKEFINEIIIRNKKLESLINREFIFDAVTKVAILIGTDLIMFNKLKRHDIALNLHIQPSTLSRVLNRLKRNNIIDIIHGKISILDKQKLELIYTRIINE